MKRKWINTLLALLVVFVAYSNESEHILHFHSDIVIEETGRVLISESIKVYAAGEDIKRGIVRSIPLYRNDNKNNKVRMDFRILSVLRDGSHEDFMTEDYGDNREIYIGNKDVLLKPGTYTYTITYETYGHIGFFDKYDELYWNVTGNGWAFTIDKASASIKLPRDTTFIKTECYTGLLSERGSDCEFDVVNGEYTFETTKKLKPNEGFTIAISFPHNMIDRSTYNTPYAAMSDKKDVDPGMRTPFIIISIIVLCSFYILTWWKTKNDQKKAFDTTHSTPPQNWTPEMIRYINNGKYDEQTFTVALMGMASRGLIRIDQEENQYILERTDKGLSTPEERAICKMLFSDGPQIIISEKNYSKIKQASSLLESQLINWKEKKEVSGNIGFVISAAAIVGIILFAYASLFTNIKILQVVFAIPIVFGLFYFAYYTMIKKKMACLGILLGFPAFVLALSGIVYSFTLMESNLQDLIFIFPVAISFPIYAISKVSSFFNIQKESINEFRSFLRTKEEPYQQQPSSYYRYTPDYFEELYPYAIALNVENEWGEKFHYILQRENYSPGWYNRRGLYSATMLPGIMYSLRDSLQRTMHYQPPAPRPRPTTYYSSDSSYSSSSDSGSSSGSRSSSSTGSSSWSSGTSSSGGSSSGRSSSSGGGRSGGGGGGGGGRGW
ncbi:MAG: DUF2207 domain-containing protein [Tannerella sp.]|jgi:uncharacterized membrane protein YgcG|nr:DUF2207 domain-containing protein [Tannerella sp.]